MFFITPQNGPWNPSIKPPAIRRSICWPILKNILMVLVPTCRKLSTASSCVNKSATCPIKMFCWVCWKNLSPLTSTWRLKSNKTRMATNCQLWAIWVWAMCLKNWSVNLTKKTTKKPANILRHAKWLNWWRIWSLTRSKTKFRRLLRFTTRLAAAAVCWPNHKTLLNKNIRCQNRKASARFSYSVKKSTTKLMPSANPTWWLKATTLKTSKSAPPLQPTASKAITLISCFPIRHTAKAGAATKLILKTATMLSTAALKSACLITGAMKKPSMPRHAPAMDSCYS